MWLSPIRSLIAVAALAIFSLSCSDQDGSEPQSADKTASETAAVSEEDLLNKPDPAGAYGTGLTLAAQTALTDILADPQAYEGKAVQVRGVVREVCPKRGCWIELAETHTSETIRVKVTDGEIVFPLSAKDQPAVVEGTIERIDLDEEANRDWQEHLAEERGETFDRESVQGAAVTWRIRGAGAQIGS